MKLTYPILTYPICCGVDVHKTFLVATIITSDFESPKYKQKRFSTFYRGLLEFKQWLLDNNCKDVCMESTGKYWVPVWNALEDSPNGFLLLRATKMTRRIQNGSAICSVWVWFQAAIYPKRIFAFCVNLRAIAASSCPCVPVRSAVFKTLSPCVI